MDYLRCLFEYIYTSFATIEPTCPYRPKNNSFLFWHTHIIYFGIVKCFFGSSNLAFLVVILALLQHSPLPKLATVLGRRVAELRAPKDFKVRLLEVLVVEDMKFLGGSIGSLNIH